MNNTSSFSHDLLKLVRKHLNNGADPEEVCMNLITVGYVANIERFGLRIARENTDDLLDSLDKINKPMKGVRWIKDI